jgi:hypothetical protein
LVAQREMLQSWVGNLDESNHYFQKDGDAGTVTKELAAGIPVGKQ